jgi:hypothetical protein
VALVLAIGVSTALCLFVVGIGVASYVSGTTLSENATQVLVASFSGIIGGLAGYMGGRQRPPSPPS